MTSLRLSHSNGSLLDVANDTLESDDGILVGEIGDVDDWPEKQIKTCVQIEKHEQKTIGGRWRVVLP